VTKSVTSLRTMRAEGWRLAGSAGSFGALRAVASGATSRSLARASHAGWRSPPRVRRRALERSLARCCASHAFGFELQASGSNPCSPLFSCEHPRRSDVTIASCAIAPGGDEKQRRWWLQAVWKRRGAYQVRGLLLGLSSKLSGAADGCAGSQRAECADHSRRSWKCSPSRHS